MSGAAVVDVAVAFRAALRGAAVARLKAAKEARCSGGGSGGSGGSDGGGDGGAALADEVLRLCDELRDKVLPIQLGVVLEDRPGGRAAWFKK